MNLYERKRWQDNVGGRTNHIFQSSWRVETEIWLSAGSGEAKVAAARRAIIENLDSIIALAILIVLKRAKCP
jgi:hypothetical protein